MAIQGSGQIKFSEIQTEFGGSNPIALSEYYGSDTVTGSGEIQISDFYGTSDYSYGSFSGGSISTSGNYKYHTFTSSGTFGVSAVPTDALSYVVIAGGGNGGGYGGGGGAGGYHCGN